MRVPILLYHYIGLCPPEFDDPYQADLWVSPERFAAQLHHLNEHGFTTVGLDHLLAGTAAGDLLPARPVIITFDDGTADNYHQAFPLLKSAGCVATFFVVTDKVGTPGHMTWPQLREMAGAGMSIESHTATHADLNRLSPQACFAELRRSREALSRELGQDSSYLAYPGGHYNQAVCLQAGLARYRAAVTTLEAISFGRGAVFELPRVRISSTDGLEEFAARLSTDHRLTYECKRIMRRHNLWRRWKRARKQARRLTRAVRRLVTSAA